MPTVTADSKSRVILPVKPGDRFDVRVSEGRVVLTKLEPVQLPVMRARKISGRWMGADVNVDPKAIVEGIRADREER